MKIGTVINGTNSFNRLNVQLLIADETKCHHNNFLLPHSSVISRKTGQTSQVENVLIAQRPTTKRISSSTTTTKCVRAHTTQNKSAHYTLAAQTPQLTTVRSYVQAR